MLPSRGLPRIRPASMLRHCAQKPAHNPGQSFSRARSTAALLSKRPSRPSSSPLIASSVFASHAGATRNWSMWPGSLWSSGSSKPAELPTPVAAPEPAAAAPPPPPPADVSSSAPSIPSDFPAPPSSGSAPLSSNPMDQISQPSSLDNLDFMSILDIPEQIGYLHNLGLDYGWGPSSMSQWLLEHIHVYAGTPWWASIAIAALVWRAALFVPTMYASRNSAITQQVMASPEWKELDATRVEVMGSQDKAQMMAYQRRSRALMQKYGVKMWMNIIPLITVPFSIGMFRVLRGMATIPVPGLETGGLLWITDLSVYDPTYILPIINVAMGFATFKLMTRVAPPTEAMKAVQGMFTYVLPPLIFVSTAWLPAAVQWFFFHLSLGTAVQTLATINPAVRRYFDLPPIKPAVPQVVLNATQLKWQAPNAKQQPAAPAPKKLSKMDELRGNMETMSKSLRDMTGDSPEKRAREQAQKYEERRKAEEHEKFLMRKARKEGKF